MVVQIREIAKYILYKLNIETIYHFPIMILSCTSFYLATGYLANESNILLVLPGIMWVFLAANDEIDLEYYFSKNDLIKGAKEYRLNSLPGEVKEKNYLRIIKLVKVMNCIRNI